MNLQFHYQVAYYKFEETFSETVAFYAPTVVVVGLLSCQT